MRSAFLALDRGARSERRPRSEGLAARRWRFRSVSSTLVSGMLALSVFACLCKSCFRGVWEQFELELEQHVLGRILRHVLRHVLRRVLHVLVPHVLVLRVSPKGKRCVGSAAGR